jgi:hypothetical protein
MRERFYVEVALGYLRLRHQLGLRTKFGRRRLKPLELQVVRALEDLEDAGETIDCEHPDPDELQAMIAEEERERRRPRMTSCRASTSGSFRSTARRVISKLTGRLRPRGWAAAPRACRSGFRPTLELLEIDEDVWHELNRRLTLLGALRRRARGRPVSEEAKKRRPWQGLTVGGLGPEEYGRLYCPRP